MQRPASLSDAEWERVQALNTDPRVKIVEEIMRKRHINNPSIGVIAHHHEIAVEIVATLDSQ
jgi:hypothetical protein